MRSSNHLFKPSCANQVSSLLFHGFPWATLLELKSGGNRALSRLWAGTFPEGHRVAGPVICHTSTKFCNFDLRVNILNIYFIYPWSSRHFLQENPATVQFATCNYIFESYKMGLQRLSSLGKSKPDSALPTCSISYYKSQYHRAVKIWTQSSSSLLFQKWHGSSEGPKHRSVSKAHTLALGDLENGPDHGWLNSWKRASEHE